MHRATLQSSVRRILRFLCTHDITLDEDLRLGVYGLIDASFNKFAATIFLELLHEVDKDKKWVLPNSVDYKTLIEAFDAFNQ